MFIFLNKVIKNVCGSKLGLILRIFIICLTGLALFIGEASAVDDYDNRYLVISPYWQSDQSSYTFIAVTHPSLSYMASQIGLELNAIQSDLSAFSEAVSITVSAGETERIFIVRSGHSIINSTSIPSGYFIVGTSDYTYGNIIIRNMASHPYLSTNTIAGTHWDGEGYRDITMLSFFGGIVFDSATTGFAMEFIGDTHDSTTTYDVNCAGCYGQTASSGVN